MVKTGLVMKKEKESPINLMVSSKINEALPLFLRGGFGVTFQYSDKVTKVADLGNEYHIKSALSEKRTINFPELSNNEQKLIGISQGDILGKFYRSFSRV